MVAEWHVPSGRLSILEVAHRLRRRYLVRGRKMLRDSKYGLEGMNLSQPTEYQGSEYNGEMHLGRLVEGISNCLREQVWESTDIIYFWVGDWMKHFKNEIRRHLVTLVMRDSRLLSFLI